MPSRPLSITLDTELGIHLEETNGEELGLIPGPIAPQAAILITRSRALANETRVFQKLLFSRSLAAYSAASSTIGRDTQPTGYRYPYAAEPIQQGYGRMGYVPEPQEADRPNPFSTPLSPETDSVVQMFLMNQQSSRNLPQQRPLYVSSRTNQTTAAPGGFLLK